MQRSQPQNLPEWMLNAYADPDCREELESFNDKEVFNDNIHGPIWLSRVEVRVINTPEFQRLRKISQLAFAQYVFNTAEHSRFSHSLGACYVSKLLVDTVNDKMMRVWTKEKMKEGSSQTFDRLHSLHQCGDLCEAKCIASSLPAYYQSITWSERVVISLATLLHDLPHCPFSHDIEGGYPELPRHDNYAKNPAMRFYLFNTQYSTLAQVLAYYSPHFLRLARLDPRWHKDARFQIDPTLPEAKCLLAELVFELHAFEDQKQDELDTVEVHPEKWPDGIVPLEAEKWPSDVSATRWKNSKWRQLYRHDIVENTICADLLDYLERDSQNAGMQHIMDFKFLEQIRLDLYQDDDANSRASERDKLRIVFDLNDFKRGTHRHDVITELFNFLQQRYFLRERVCYHRVTQAGAAMLKRAAALVFLEDQKPENSDHRKLTLQMLHLDLRCNSDDSLLRYLATDCGQTTQSSLLECWANPSLESHGVVSADISRRLLERRLYRPVVILSGDRLNGVIVRGRDDVQKIVEELYKVVMLDKANAKALGYNDGEKQEAWQNLSTMEEELERLLSGASDSKGGVITYCLKPQFGYKRPAVLVRWENNTVQTLEKLKKAQGVAEQIGAMEKNYTALWRLFVFVKPEYLVPHGSILSEAEIVEQCNKAARHFLTWAHSVDNGVRYQAETLEMNLNGLKIEEVVSGKRENCRDIRFGFNTTAALETSSQPQESFLPTIMVEPNKLTLVEVEPSPLSWREIAKTYFGDTTIREFAKVFKDEGIGSNDAECLICFDLLVDRSGIEAENNVEAARSRKKASNRLRDIIRSRRLEKAKQDEADTE